MSTRSDNIRASAARLIRGNGKLISYVLVTPGAYSTSTRKVAITKTAKDVRVVISKIARSYEEKDGYQIGDLRITVSALDITTPTPGDRLLIDGAEWAVVGVTPVYCESDPVTYKIHARRT